ncbi:MAG: TonB-dependent receptor, partial [Myxococcaceae bacterium]
MRTILATLIGVALLTSPNRARAEEAALPSVPSETRAGAVTLPPVVVPVPDALPDQTSLERIDPTGARSTVERKDHVGEAKESSELIATSVGAQLQDTGGQGQMKTVSVRGASGNGVLVYLDGVPLQGAGGMVDLSRIPAAMVDRFELLRGGTAGLGGALNIVTRRPTRGARIAGEASYGSFSTFNGHLAGSGALWGGSGLVL